jgi:hypothetical protein
MKLFDRFVKKTPAVAADRNFVDDLVSYFGSRPEVNAAYFGFAYNNAEKAYHLFLAVDHQGEAATIQQLTWTIKSAYMSDTRIHYACRANNPDLLDYISQHNPPFYHKEDTTVVQQKVMKQWFNVDKYQPELIEALSQTDVLTLTHKLNAGSDQLKFATHVREGAEFVPLFSKQEMIAKSGINDIPQDRAVMKMPFAMLQKMVGQRYFFVLNPGTPFEVELHV